MDEAIEGMVRSRQARGSGAITDEEFVARVEGRTVSLSESLLDLAATVETRRLLRTQASQLYRSIVRRRLQKPDEEK